MAGFRRVESIEGRVQVGGVDCPDLVGEMEPALGGSGRGCVGASAREGVGESGLSMLVLDGLRGDPAPPADPTGGVVVMLMTLCRFRPCK